MAWLARPPGVGREQEVLLASAVRAGLTDTIAAQLHGAVAVAQDVHPVPALYEDLFFFLRLVDNLCGRAALLGRTTLPGKSTCYVINSIWMSQGLNCLRIYLNLQS